MATDADLRAVSKATARRDKADEEWGQAITNAVNETCSLKDVAEVAGISPSTVRKIVDEMRKGTFRN